MNEIAVICLLAFLDGTDELAYLFLEKKLICLMVTFRYRFVVKSHSALKALNSALKDCNSTCEKRGGKVSAHLYDQQTKGFKSLYLDKGKVNYNLEWSE